ncbi:hypothetical protein GGF46_003958 [Coemansia sp. RSA 552]|nr:hypothetical protein GGF46_003958 [Coemansia sp. RSA 552]
MEERLAELAARLDEEVRGRKAVEKRLAAIEKENTAFRVALMGMLRSGVEATEKLVSGTVVGKPSVLERCSSPQEEGQVGDRDGGMRGYGVCQDKDEMTEAQELDSNGWAIGVNNTGWSLADEAEAGWSSVEGTQGWNIIGPKDQEGGPVMPTSVNQIMTGGQPSSDDKVKQWKVAGAVGADSLATQDMEQDGLAKLPDLRAWDGEPASTGPDLNNKVLYDDDDDDDDDEGNLLGLLRSKDYRSEIASSVLFDSTGTKITVDRIGVLWRACGWVPPDSLPHYYKKQYGVPMMEEGAWKKMRAALCTMQGVTASEIRLGSEGDSTCKLLFKDDGHLKGRGVYSRLFVDVRVPEPVLYFYLVTTVMRPLEYHQGDVVMQLWASIQDKSPLDVCAVRTASDRTGRRGTDINQLWYNAIHWLRDLVQRGLNLGFKRIIEKVDEWSSNPGLGVNSTRDASNPEAKAVLGLGRSELRGLFYVTPILLKTILPEGDLLWLDQQLESI